MGGSSLAHWLVLAITGVLEGALLWKAWLSAHTSDEKSFRELEGRFGADLVQRSKRGHSPDWTHYLAETDRLFESRDDLLRSLAAAALALGLGGTILALISGLVVDALREGSSFDMVAVIRGLGVSLFGSFSGVIVNLAIVLLLLPRAEERFLLRQKKFQANLRHLGEQHQPEESFTQTLREELGIIRQALNTEFASAFSTAITGFPEVVTNLGLHVEKLAKVVENQGASIGGALTDLKTSAIAVAQSSTYLQPATQRLAAAAAVLVNMPRDLQAALNETRTQWTSDLREQHEAHLQQLLELQKQIEEASSNRERQMLAEARSLGAAVTEVRHAVAQMPTQLADEVARASTKIGTAFGQEARNHTNELADRLEREYQAILTRIEQHEQQWRNNISSVVAELFEQIGAQFESGLVEALGGLVQRLQETAAQLPTIAERLETANREWSSTQEESLRGWKAASETTRDAALKLVEADGQLRMGVGALTTTAEHLKEVAQVTSGFQAALRSALQEVTSNHLAGLAPLEEATLRRLTELGERQAALDGYLESQAQLIQRCIAYLMKGRQLATLEAGK